MGYVWDLNLFNYFTTKIVFLFLLIGSFNIYNQNKFLYTIYLLLIVFFYIPNSILFAFSNFPIGPFVSNVFFVSLFLLSPYIQFTIPNWSIPNKYKSIFLASVVLLLLIPIILAFGTNINLKTLLLSEVYETRELFSEKLKGLLAYLYNIEAKTIIPVALVFFMMHKRHYFIAACIFMLLYLYVISGNKLVYFTSISVVFFFYVGRTYVSKLSNFFLVIITAFILFPIIDTFILKTPLLAGTFVNRFLFIPALLTQFYFDFFNNNPLYFAESHFFKLFVNNPYDKQIGFILADVYWPSSGAYLNNGIVSDGFMNLNYWGVLLFSIAFTLLFSLFNSFKLDKGFYGIFFCYIYLFLSAPFLSLFITGGILIFIALSFTVLRQTK